MTSSSQPCNRLADHSSPRQDRFEVLDQACCCKIIGRDVELGQLVFFLVAGFFDNFSIFTPVSLAENVILENITLRVKKFSIVFCNTIAPEVSKLFRIPR